MITIESVFSKKNQRQALDILRTRKNGGGTDKMSMDDFVEYWNLNQERIYGEIKSCRYSPTPIQEYEIVNGKGKKRTVINMSQTDRYISRLLTQKLSAFFEPMFPENSFAYRKDKGVARAIELVKAYIEGGKEYVVEIDVKGFFDEISIEKMVEILKGYILDKAVIELLKSYFYCTLIRDGEHYRKERGLLQGSSMSPVLSNLYLLNLDKYMEASGYCWMRFADNIYLFVDNQEKGVVLYSQISDMLKNDYQLPVNRDKSGVFSVFEHRILGYDIHKKRSGIEIVKHVYQKQDYYRNWHECTVEKVNREYHIVQAGIMNKKDYALLFENGEEKHHIPVETTEQMNLYNEVMISSSVIQTLCQNKIRLCLFDKYGNMIGYFIPESFTQDARVLLQQCQLYLDEKKRTQVARKMEIAAMHNIRANVRYYNKQNEGQFDQAIEQLSVGITDMNECKTVDEMLLVEARCRQTYYQLFNSILHDDDYLFEKRTRRPPMDKINALISFGNTLLYNRIQQIIWRTSLDSRIGIFHATNRRHYSLNLDFADLFKPIIVDRIIFTLINKHQLGENSFEPKENGAVYLSESGKKLFIESFEQKMQTKIKIENKEITYAELIDKEIRKYQKFVVEGSSYKPYKYY